jgi:hypothetical protein
MLAEFDEGEERFFDLDWVAQARTTVWPSASGIERVKTENPALYRQLVTEDGRPAEILRGQHEALMNIGTAIDAEIEERLAACPEADGAATALENRREARAAHAALLAEWDAENDLTRLLELEQRIEQAEEAVVRVEEDVQMFSDLYYTKRREIAFATLARLRPFGGRQLPVDTEHSEAHGLRKLQDAAEFLPSDWIEASRAEAKTSDRVLVVSESPNGRGFYDAEGRQIAVPLSDVDNRDRAGSVHELVHHIEDVHGRLRVAEWCFYERRTRNGDFDGEQEQPLPLSELTTKGRYLKGELARPDHFPDPYIGKVYEAADSQASFEILSVGLDDLVRGLGLIDSDSDLRQFVYGALAIL